MSDKTFFSKEQLTVVGKLLSLKDKTHLIPLKDPIEGTVGVFVIDKESNIEYCLLHSYADKCKNCSETSLANLEQALLRSDIELHGDAKKLRIGYIDRERRTYFYVGLEAVRQSEKFSSVLKLWNEKTSEASGKLTFDNLVDSV